MGCLFGNTFFKNVDRFETTQLFCIPNYLTGSCIIRVLTERCFWTDYNKFANVPRSVSGIDLLDMNVNLWFSFSLWIVTSVMSCPEHFLLIYYLTLPLVDSTCPPVMGHTLCSCIFHGIIAFHHSTCSSASSFLMLRSLRSFVITSLQQSCRCPLGRIPGTM